MFEYWTNVPSFHQKFGMWSSDQQKCVCSDQKYGGSAGFSTFVQSIYINAIQIKFNHQIDVRHPTLSIYPSPIGCFTTAKAQPLRQWGFWSHFFFMSSTLSAQRPQICWRFRELKGVEIPAASGLKHISCFSWIVGPIRKQTHLIWHRCKWLIWIHLKFGFILWLTSGPESLSLFLYLFAVSMKDLGACISVSVLMENWFLIL